MSREAALRSTDDWKDTTMPTEAATCPAVIGLDVGKFSHWACHAARRGEVLRSKPAANTEHDLDDLFDQVDAGTLVVVDQARNIGSLAISRARLAGLPVACLPGTAAHGAARLFAGDAKTDERDAAVIAKTALGIPDSLLPAPKHGERLEAARSMAAQRNRMVACSTRDKNRLRSILPESCPAFEALADPTDPRWLKMMESPGGPWGIVDAGKAAVGAVTRGADRARVDAAIAAAATSTRPSEYRVMAENPQVKMLAGRIGGSAEEAARLDVGMTALLVGDDAHACLLSIPGIGPGTASELVISIDVNDLPDRDRLASCCGIAPRNRRSGESISSVSSSRRGNKRLKNLLIFSRNSLSRSKGRFGDCYRGCGDRGMRHGEALKAVARKRLKVVYAIMGDRVPYSAWPAVSS